MHACMDACIPGLIAQADRRAGVRISAPAEAVRPPRTDAGPGAAGSLFASCSMLSSKTLGSEGLTCFQITRAGPASNDDALQQPLNTYNEDGTRRLHNVLFIKIYLIEHIETVFCVYARIVSVSEPDRNGRG